MRTVLLTCVCGMVSPRQSLRLSPPLTLLSVLQVPGQLHGGCTRRLHEGQQTQRHAHHHPSQEMHGAHTDHLSSGQKAQTGVPASHGGGRGAGQQAGGGWTSGSSVPRVGGEELLF